MEYVANAADGNAASTGAFPLFAQLCGEIGNLNQLQKKYLESHARDIPPTILRDCEWFIKYCLKNNETIEFLARAYSGFVETMNGEQYFFAREGRYRYSSLKEVSALVYDNPQYMTMYMRGLALTMFLWPQHRMIRGLFQDDFLKRDISGKYLEVGPGHGMFFLQALKSGKFDLCSGIDISPSSIAYTRDIVMSQAPGKTERYELVCADFLTHSFAGKFDAVVIGEVLEHVESPDSFIHRIGSLLADKGVVFLTTCINAAALDHIYNFENFDRLNAMFAQSNLAVLDFKPIPYVGKSVEQCVRKRFPMNVVYVLAPIR